ncbi:MAG TPA: hypothetical protein VEK07_12350 [Polyangiaceae bacterium]|nr:hypothetical protein [Polyangiaceae bacterium]
MFKLAKDLWKRLVVDECPAEIDKCLECGKIDCDGGEFEVCAARRQRQADVENARGEPAEEKA